MFASPAKAKRRTATPPKVASPSRAGSRTTIGNQASLRRLAADASIAPPLVHDALRGSGRPLAPATRAFFEARIGADLAAVRLHDDARAARSAKAIGALAYAVGAHVVLGEARFGSSPPESVALLAHELAHVVQARAAGEDAVVRRQSADDEPKKDPKPLMSVFGTPFSIVPYGPLPGGSGPSPYDAPGKVSDPAGKGPSTEDLNKGAHVLLDKDPPKAGLNTNYKFPECPKLELPGSTRAARKYWTFEQYDLQRKLMHTALTKDPWPPMTRDQYDAAIQACPKGYGPINVEPPVPPAAPAPDMPSVLPPGQAYA